MTIEKPLFGRRDYAKLGLATAAGAALASVPGLRSARAADGMDALIAAAKKEGKLNVITLPRDWANYGAIMDQFTAKYGIAIDDANPDGSSAQELQAVRTLKGQAAPRTHLISARPLPRSASSRTCSLPTRSPPGTRSPMA